jgi:hypothetical protein
MGSDAEEMEVEDDAAAVARGFCTGVEPEEVEVCLPTAPAGPGVATMGMGFTTPPVAA